MSDISERDKIDSRYNFICCLIDAVGFSLGMAFFDTTTIAPLFLSHLHASHFLIGFLPAIINLGNFAPGLLVAGAISRLTRARGWLRRTGLWERIALLLIAVLTFTWGSSYPRLLLISFFVLYAIAALCTGLNIPAYYVVIGKSIPTLWRGRLFGYAGLTAGVLGFGVGPVTRHFLSGPRGGFPQGFADCFLIGIFVTILSFLPLCTIREPKGHLDETTDTGHCRLNARKVLREDASLRRLVWSQVTFALFGAALPFYLLACVSRFHIGPGAVAACVAITVVSGSLGGPLWGAWSDRRGRKEVLLAAQACGIAASVLALIAPSAVAFYFVLAGVALCTGGVRNATNNLVMELAPSHRNIPQYMALKNGISAPFTVLAPVAGGALVDHFGFSPTFALAALASFASLIISLSIQEPRRVPIAATD